MTRRARRRHRFLWLGFGRGRGLRLTDNRAQARYCIGKPIEARRDLHLGGVLGLHVSDVEAARHLAHRECQEPPLGFEQLTPKNADLARKAS